VAVVLITDLPFVVVAVTRHLSNVPQMAMRFKCGTPGENL
jgi:hypothetical protein